MSFENFGSFALQKKVGNDLLQTLENILPAIDHTLDSSDIYRTNNLSKILSAFTDSNLFKDNEFRRDYLLLQQEAKIDQLCRSYGVNTTLNFEQKVDQLISKGWKNSSFCKSFIESFQLPDKYFPQAHVIHPNTEILEKARTPFKTLKDYQSSVYFKSKKKLENRLVRFIVQMPTGSGKTRTSMEFITDMLINNKEGAIVIWLVYSEELCEQAVESFIEVWEHVGNKDISLIRAWGTNTLYLPPAGQSAFIVGGFQKLNALIDKQLELFKEIATRTTMIVVDEAHKVLAPTYKRVTDALTGDNTRVVGLTATPGRSLDDDLENKKLSEYFNDEKIDIDTPDGIPVIKYLKNRGVLAHAVFTSLKTTPTFNLSKKDLNYIEERFDFPPGFLLKLGTDETRNIEIIKELLINLKAYKKVLFFACSVEHSKFICSILCFMGVSAAHIDGSTDKGARRHILEQFKDGSLQVICNYGILSTGFDAPKTDLVFIARPTRSIVLYSQMIGRGLRGPLIGGTSSCKIVTVKDNIIGLPNEDQIFRYFDEYFEK